MKTGISLYPGLGRSCADELALLEEAAAMGITRVFTSLHIPESDTDVLSMELQEILSVARHHHFDVIADVSPKTQELLNLPTLTPEHLLSLYNAVTGKDYRDPDALNVVTLENAVYMGMKNDLAFVLEMGMYLYEHQSTYNPNIPLRDLFYIASEYQALADGKSLYSSGIQKIPTPKFLVFYNGLDRKVPDRMELRLSMQALWSAVRRLPVFFFRESH